MQEHRAHAVVDRAQGAFGLAILCRSVGARETEGHPMFLKVAAHGVVIEFSAIISL